MTILADSDSNSPPSLADRDAVMWLLQQVLQRTGRHVHESAIRSTVLESAEAFVGHAGYGWWRWVLESGGSLDVPCRVVDADFKDILTLARAGSYIVIRRESVTPADAGMPGDSGWFVLASRAGGALELWSASEGKSQVRLGADAIRRELGVDLQGGLIRCVVLQTELHTADDGVISDIPKAPLSRMWELLGPEMSDIRVILVFALFSGLLGMTTPLAVEALVNTVAFGRFLQPIVVLALMLFTFLSFQAAMTILQGFVTEIIQQRLFARVAADLAYRLPRTRAGEMTQQNRRELVNRFFDVVTVQKVTAGMLLDGLSLLLSVLVGMAVLAFYHPLLLAYDILLVMLMLFTMFVLGRGGIKTSIKESKAKYAMAAWLEDLAGCETTFRVDGAAEFALEQADRRIYDYLQARKKHFRVLLRQNIFSLGTQAVSTTVLLGIGGWLVISGQLSLGQLVAAELIVAVVVGGFAKMGKHVEAFYDLMASIDKLGVLFDLPMERHDGILESARGAGATIVAENLTCTFQDGRRELQIGSVTIPAGARAGLTGPSGVGKSTLLNLLYGLRAPGGGRLRINGIDPRDMRPDMLRRHVALVRGVEVFDGTVAEHVHLERPDVRMNEVREALEIVGLTSFIQELPERLDTSLAQHGGIFTDNQLRLLMIAQAIAGRPDLLLLDGVLDVLPDEDARHLFTALSSPDRPWTIVLVTGRADLLRLTSPVIPLKNPSQRLESAVAPN